MKIGLFLALLVLLASTNVFGETNRRTGERQGRPSRTKTTTVEGDQNNPDRTGSDSDKIMMDGQREPTKAAGQSRSDRKSSQPNELLSDDNKPLAVIREETKPITVLQGGTQSGTIVRGGTSSVSVVQGESQPVSIVSEETQPVTFVKDPNRSSTLTRGGSSSVSLVQSENQPASVVRGGSSSVTVVQGESQPASVGRGGSSSVTVVQGESQPASVGRGGSSSVTVVQGESQPTSVVRGGTPSVTVVQGESQPASVGRGGSSSVTVVQGESQPASMVRDGTPSVTVVRNEAKPVAVIREETKPVSVVRNGNQRVPDTNEEGSPVGVENEHQTEEGENIKPDEQELDVTTQANMDESHDDEDNSENETTVPSGVNNQQPGLPITPNDVPPVSDKIVHVSGNIILVKYRSSVVDSVQYDLDGARFTNGVRPLLQTRVPFAQDFIAHGSRATLYVSTTKTIDRKFAFAKFPIAYEKEHFPLSFDIDVELPDKQRGLLERADITLYFFVYITNLETRIDTFLPAGTSQILLQGTNQLVQKLDVFVRASGIEINGLFRGRFGQRFIRPGTSFQVLVVPEQSLQARHILTSDSIAQLTINNVPAMFPVPFSFLVRHQMLRLNTKYFAIAYVFENGVRRMIHQEPVFVINEEKILVTPQVIFTVVPSPFILRGSVTRSMPGSFFLQPHSSLILRLHEIGSDSNDIIFKLPEILTLPQLFQVNISQSNRFDPSKNYDIRALITDEKNDIYMSSLQPIPLLDEFSRLIVPVDDLLYYVQVRLHSSSNQLLNYIPGSTAQIFVTESPDTPTKPIVAMRIDTIDADFHDFLIRVPATAIQRGRNYYLVMMIEMNGIITHVSKSLLISNNQPPPLIIQLPVLSLNLVRGVIFDVDNRPAQWSSSAYANLFLLDDKAEDPDKAIVQVWKIHLENDFPVRFEVQLDFSRLRPDHVYRLQSAIENGRSVLEYKPAGSVLALNPSSGILSDVRIPVRNVKTFQLVKGLIYINDINTVLPEKSEIIVQLSSSPSLTHPSIIDEIHIKVENRTLPIDFTMNLPLNKIDINSVYYFLVRYMVRDNVIIPVSQAFAFSPRNEATVVLTLSKTPQIPITGQVTSTGSPLILPSDSTLHLYITDSVNQDRPTIVSEVFLQATPNSLYEFTMNIDSVILQKKIPLYLRADILYQNAIILSIPRPALLQITPGGEWNINLVVDLPTLIIGQIVSMSQQERISGELDVYIQILERGTQHIVYTSQLRLDANLPQKFRIEIDNELFTRYPALQARAVIKNCKDQILFESGAIIDIFPGLNLHLDLPVILTDRKKFTELHGAVNEVASLNAGSWRLSVTGVVSDSKNGDITALDNNFVLQK